MTPEYAEKLLRELEAIVTEAGYRPFESSLTFIDPKKDAQRIAHQVKMS